MFCRYCGQEIGEEFAFCPKCGKPTTAVEKADESKPEEPKETTEVKWYYKSNDVVKGPFFAQQIREKIKSGEIGEFDKLKDQTQKEWTYADETIFSKEFATVEQPTISISDKWVWALAIIPELILIIIGYYHMFPTVEPWIISLGVWILNCGLLWLDETELSKKGISNKWFYLGIIIFPVYLIVREIKTNHNFVPAVINVFLIAIEIFLI